MKKETKIVKSKIKKSKESKFTKKIRENPYIATTFALGLFCIILILGSIIEDKTINKNEDEILCSVIGATPAWAVDGKIVQYGIVIPQNISIDLVGTTLIPKKIKLLYNPECSACKAQINYFKEQGTWDAYLKEGLVINCQDILK